MPNKGGKGASGRLTPKQKSQQGGTTSNQAMNAAQFLASLGNNSNYAQQAADIYAPQFDYLNQQGSQLKQNYGQGDAKLASLFANLVSSIQGDRGQIRSDYGSAIGANNSNTSAGLRTIEGNYDRSQSDAAKLLQSLGISDSIGYALGSSDRGKNAYEASLASNGAAYGNQLNSERTSSLEYNRDQANISKQMGTEARSGLTADYQKALAALAGQRAQLQSQQRSQALGLQQSAAAQAYKQQQDQIQNELALKKIEMQYGAGSPAANKAMQLQGPGGALASEASKLYGTQSGAENAIKAVTDTLAQYGDKTPTNINEFVSAVLKRNPHATDVQQLTDLAQLLYQQLGFKNPSPLY